MLAGDIEQMINYLWSYFLKQRMCKAADIAKIINYQLFF